ncbi:SH3-like domain-containing protein [Microtetraspora niveoalba]|uniref:SH3-like domain-containing protein n=1 Tax=Microtetraspora niveoalba TaxID=46175 RepID=UPI0008324600
MTTTPTPRFQVGDQVTVRDATTMFHTRTQGYVRGHTGTVTEHRPAWIVPEDEAFGIIENGRYTPFYVVRFKQTDLWPDYTGFEVDTLETECSELWLEPAGKEKK